MGEPARLPNERLASAVAAGYGLSVAALTYLPLGADSESAVYRLEADRSYFLKLRTRAGFSAKSLELPRYLHGLGLPHVPAPLATNAGTAWVDLDDYVLSLHPFIEGRTATEAGLSPADWRGLGATVRQVHTCVLPADLQKIVSDESYIPSRWEVLAALQPTLDAGGFADPVARELTRLWRARKGEIDLLLSRCEALGQRVRAAALPPVLCHADLHTWNVLVDDSGQFWIVDWDESVRAPKERDLMFVVGGIGAGLVGAAETAAFLQGYGESTIDPLALTYYRHAWAVQDLAAYAEQACLRPELSEAARRGALDGFKQVLAPGQIAEIALASLTP
jgi:spectinomycin phosphotransferase